MIFVLFPVILVLNILYIIEVVAVVAELIEADSEVLTLQVINSDKRLAALRAYTQTA